MLEFSEAVIAYTRGQTLASWQADPMRMDATLRKLTLIGEAATRARRHPRAGAGHPVAQDRGHA
ncbi:MAG: HepT-like ribonuclease domain-containing protein [Rubrivivax sp.]